MKRKSSMIAIILLLLIMVSVLFLIPRNTKKEDPLQLVFVAKIMGIDSDFYKLLMNGAKMAAEEYKVDLKIVAPEKEEDFQKQNALIEEAIEQKPDAILLSASSYTETTDTARKIKEQGIKLILVDSGVEEPISDSFVETNNRKAGEQLGEYMQTIMNEDTMIAIIGHTKNSSTARERKEGIEKGFQHKEKIAEVVYCDSDYNKAYAQVVSLLNKYPQIDLLAGTNEYAMVGTARAVKDLGLSGKVRVVGIDSSQEAISLMEEGVIGAFVVQNPFKMGYVSVEAAVKTIQGEPVMQHIDTGATLVTKDNMYTPDNQKLLFLFDGE